MPTKRKGKKGKTPKKSSASKIKKEEQEAFVRVKEEEGSEMSSAGNSPKRELTPSFSNPISSIPQKRVLDDDHQPAVSSPLNPDFKPAKQEDAPIARDRTARAKKESLKKRESKGGSLGHDGSARATPEPKSKKKEENTLVPLRIKHLGPRITDFEAPRGPTFLPSHTKRALDGTEIEFHETTDHVYNKKGFYYTYCIADPAFPSSVFYRQSETEPFNARLSFEHISSHMMLDESAKQVTTDKGFRMAKANVCAREGRWYWECKITSGIPKRKRSDPHARSGGHVRMGWARREATLDAPVGFDAYSYGLRDVQGQSVFLSRPKDFFPTGEDIKEGDVIGLEINLPSEHLQRKILAGEFNPKTDLPDEPPATIERADIIRDRLPIRFKSHLYFEHVDYSPCKELEELMNPSIPFQAPSSGVPGAHAPPKPTHPIPALRTLPESNIKIYKNGVFMGTPFTNLLCFLPPASKPLALQLGAREGADDGMLGYYPAVSVFRGGAAEVNLGPDFWFPPPDLMDQDDEVDMVGSDQVPINKLKKLRAMAERYDEQIVEDIVYDIVDEVDFWMQDGGKTVARSNGVGAVQAGAGRDEIRELVQDDE